MFYQTRKQFEFSSSAFTQTTRSHATRPRVFHGGADLAIAERGRLHSSRLWRAAGKLSVSIPLYGRSPRHAPKFPITGTLGLRRCCPA